MRIAIITETFQPQINGVVTILQEILSYARQQRHEIILFAPYTTSATHVETFIVRLSGIRLPFYPEIYATPPQHIIYDSIRSFRPDLIHAIGVTSLGIAAEIGRASCRERV